LSEKNVADDGYTIGVDGVTTATVAIATELLLCLLLLCLRLWIHQNLHFAPLVTLLWLMNLVGSQPVSSSCWK
jgi:hypothetical protein